MESQVRLHCEATWEHVRVGVIGRLLPLTYGVCPPGEAAMSLALSLAQPSARGLSRLSAMKINPTMAAEAIDRLLPELEAMTAWDEVSIRRSLAGLNLSDRDEAVLMALIAYGVTGFRFESIMAALGKDEALRRLRDGISEYKLHSLIG